MGKLISLSLLHTYSISLSYIHTLSLNISFKCVLLHSLYWLFYYAALALSVYLYFFQICSSSLFNVDTTSIVVIDAIIDWKMICYGHSVEALQVYGQSGVKRRHNGTCIYSLIRETTHFLVTTPPPLELSGNIFFGIIFC